MRLLLVARAAGRFCGSSSGSDECSEQWTLKNPASGPPYEWHTFPHDGLAEVLADPTPSQLNADRVVYLSPHTGHALFASVNLTGNALRSFLYDCRHLGAGSLVT